MTQKFLIGIITSLLVTTFGLAIKDTSFREPFAKIACGSIAALVQISKNSSPPDSPHDKKGGKLKKE
jgi:hypothetical protein